MTRVQSASGFDFSGAPGVTQAAVLGLNVTGGNLIAVGLTFGGTDGSELTSVTDTLGNTYAIVDRVVDGLNSQCAASAYAKSIAGGACVLTANFSATAYRGVWAMEISGRDATAPLEANSANWQNPSGTGTDVITSGSDTTVTDGCDIYAFQIASGGVTADTSAGTGFTQFNLDSSVADTSHEIRNQATAGAVEGTFSTGTTGQRLTVMMAFKPAAGGGGGTAVPVFVNNLRQQGIA